MNTRSDVLGSRPSSPHHADASKAENVVAVANSLAAALSPFDPTITAQSIGESATAAKGAYSIATLTEDDFAQVQDQVTRLLASMSSTNPISCRPIVIRARTSDTGEEEIIDDVDGKSGVECRHGEFQWRGYGCPHRDLATAVAIVLDQPRSPDPERGASRRRCRIEPAMMSSSNVDGRDIGCGAEQAGRSRRSVATTVCIRRLDVQDHYGRRGHRNGVATPTPRSVPWPDRDGDRSIQLRRVLFGTVRWQPRSLALQHVVPKIASDLRRTPSTSGSRARIGPNYEVAGLPTASGSVHLPTTWCNERRRLRQGKVVVSRSDGAGGGDSCTAFDPVRN